MRYKKYLLMFSILLVFTSISFISAETFNSSILDGGIVYSNPSMKIDSNGVTHIVYSNKTDLLYINSSDNYQLKRSISNNLSGGGNFYQFPSLDIDSNNNLHVAFKVGANTYYTNSLGWNIKNLNVGYASNSLINLKLDSNNKLYIASDVYNGVTDQDIVILSSTNFNTFNSQIISKNAEQMNPVLAINGTRVHLIYFDWSDGIGLNANNEQVGLYKTRYRSSQDNFASELNVSNASRSFDGDIQIDSNGDVWVAFKDSTEDIPGQEFTSGMVWVANKNNNWAKTIVRNLTTFMQDRPIDLAISNDGVRHLSWSEKNNSQVNIMYGRVNSPAVVTLQDVGYDPRLGFVAIDTFNNNPYIVANIHSLADYKLLVDVPSDLDLLNAKVNNLTIEVEKLKTRVNYLELIINYTKQFPLFNDFWIWVNSPKECTANQYQCVNNISYSCVNYAWTQNQICSYGCNVNGQCNAPPVVKEDCTKKFQYICSGSYSVSTGYSCKVGQGTDTSCNVNQCVLKASYTAKWTLCSKGCNTLNGQCKL